MKLNEVFAPVEEGKNDKYIFKAVFTAGGPGSGKSTVSKKIFGHLGFREVNIDRFIEFLSKRDKKDLKNVDLETIVKSDGLVGKSLDVYIDGRLPLLIDGTGRDYSKITKMADTLKSFGYDVALLFVNTDLETAKERNQARDRTVDDEYLTNVWKQSQRNIGTFQDYFGNDMFIVDNNDKDVDLTKVEKRVGAFLRKPVTNPKAKEWLDETTTAGSIAFGVPGTKHSGNGTTTSKSPKKGAIGAGFDPDGDKGVYE